MELHPYYSVLQKRPHLEAAGPRHGDGTPRVPAAAQQGSAGTVWANLVHSNPIRIDGATSILLYFTSVAAFGNCMSAAWPWEPASACCGSIGFCGHCLGQFISPNLIRMDGATSILFCSANVAAFGNCRSAAWLWEPTGACRGSIGFCRHCLGQFISPRSDQNGWRYIHITLFRKCSCIWKLQVCGMAMGPRKCLPRLNRVLQALFGPI